MSSARSSPCPALLAATRGRVGLERRLRRGDRREALRARDGDARRGRRARSRRAPAASYVDATLGGGGHTVAHPRGASRRRASSRFDRDPARASRPRDERLAPFGDRVTLVHATLLERARGSSTRSASSGSTGSVADLGVSSPQLDDADARHELPPRGPARHAHGPRRAARPRSSSSSGSSDDELADVIFHYGDERRSRRIARSIKQALADGELATTLDLRRAIVRAVGPARVGGVDPATRTFQALRIAVNGELDELEALLAALPDVVARGRRRRDHLASTRSRTAS